MVTGLFSILLFPGSSFKTGKQFTDADATNGDFFWHAAILMVS
jgi:hypothetical protein